MGSVEDETRYERVTVRLRGDGDPGTEQLWATAIEATEVGGSYRLAGSGFRSPLVLDDVVRVVRNGDDELQVIDVLERGGRPGWLVHLADDQPQLELLVDEWTVNGTVVEWQGWTVSAALAPAGGTAGRPTEAELAELSRCGLVLGYVRLSCGTELTADEAYWMHLGCDPAPAADGRSSSGAAPHRRAG
jgi:hypothetical protein